VHFSRHIAPQIPAPEKWNNIKHCAISYIFENVEMFYLKIRKLVSMFKN